MQRLRKAKATELRKTLGGQESSDKQILASLKRTEMARYCKRRTCGVDVTRRMIQSLLDAMWELTDTTGLRLINADSMQHIWKVQQKHLPCIQDVPGVELYTKVGTSEKGGQVLDVYIISLASPGYQENHPSPKRGTDRYRVLPVILITFDDETVTRTENSYTLEEKIDEKFDKVMNNTGRILKHNGDRVEKLLAFAHFTMEKYKGKAMVTDLQGEHLVLSKLHRARGGDDDTMSIAAGDMKELDEVEGPEVVFYSENPSVFLREMPLSSSKQRFL